MCACLVHPGPAAKETIMRLVIADDHALFRDGLRSLLEAHGFDIAAEARDGREAVLACRAHQPDVVLMDISMPEMTGLEATRLISAELPAVRVVILTASDRDADLFDAIKSGASGYLSKDLESDQFVALLNGVMRGEPAISPEVARKMLGELARGVATERSEPDVILTDRERDVLELLVSGVTSNRDLADRLFVSENTIKFHLRNILDKLHLSSRAQVIAYAMQHRLVDPPGAP
jgi:DNA-binding NarL/FixJ family response regulator